MSGPPPDPPPSPDPWSSLERVDSVINALKRRVTDETQVMSMFSSADTSVRDSTPRTSVCGSVTSKPPASDSGSGRPASFSGYSRPKTSKEAKEDEKNGSPSTSKRPVKDRACLFCDRLVNVPSPSSWYNFDTQEMEWHPIYGTRHVHQECVDQAHRRIAGSLGNEILQGIENRDFLRANWTTTAREARKAEGGEYPAVSRTSLEAVSTMLRNFERLDKESALCLQMIREWMDLTASPLGTDQYPPTPFKYSIHMLRDGLSPKSAVFHHQEDLGDESTPLPALFRPATAPAALETNAEATKSNAAPAESFLLKGYESYQLAMDLISAHRLSQVAAAAAIGKRKPSAEFKVQAVDLTKAAGGKKLVAFLARGVGLTLPSLVNLHINRDTTNEFAPCMSNAETVSPLLEEVLLLAIPVWRKCKEAEMKEMRKTVRKKQDYLSPKSLEFQLQMMPGEHGEEDRIMMTDDNLEYVAKRTMLQLRNRESLSPDAAYRICPEPPHPVWGIVLSRLRKPSRRIVAICRDHKVSPQLARRVLRGLVVDRYGVGWVTGDRDGASIKGTTAHHEFYWYGVQKKWNKRDGAAREEELSKSTESLCVRLKRLRARGEQAVAAQKKKKKKAVAEGKQGKGKGKGRENEEEEDDENEKFGEEGQKDETKEKEKTSKKISKKKKIMTAFRVKLAMKQQPPQEEEQNEATSSSTSPPPLPKKKSFKKSFLKSNKTKNPNKPSSIEQAEARATELFLMFRQSDINHDSGSGRCDENPDMILNEFIRTQRRPLSISSRTAHERAEFRHRTEYEGVVKQQQEKRKETEKIEQLRGRERNEDEEEEEEEKEEGEKEEDQKVNRNRKNQFPIAIASVVRKFAVFLAQ